MYLNAFTRMHQIAVCTFYMLVCSNMTCSCQSTDQLTNMADMIYISILITTEMHYPLYPLIPYLMANVLYFSHKKLNFDYLASRLILNIPYSMAGRVLILDTGVQNSSTRIDRFYGTSNTTKILGLFRTLDTTVYHCVVHWPHCVGQ